MKIRKELVIVTLIVGVLTILLIPKEKEAVSLATEALNFKKDNIISMYVSDSNGTEEKNGIKYIELSSEDRMPSEGYTINEENSYCYNGSKDNINTNAKLYTNEEGEHVIEKIQKGDKCILYFDKPSGAKDDIIADKEVLERTSENKDFNVPFTEDTTGKIYKAQDDDGTSYYFAGSPTDNWMQFGKNSSGQSHYWRIIRINGDGTIRMIYSGTGSPQTEGEGTQIGTSAFNSFKDDNKYVGYFYEDGNIHGLDTASTIYGIVNAWFSTPEQGNLTTPEYFNNIDPNAGFCNDRTPSTINTPTVNNGVNVGNGSGGTGTTTTYYGAFLRLRPDGSTPSSSTTAVTPSLKCTNSDDLFTYSGANQGNKKLANPVGLITADEASLAGAVQGSQPTSFNYLGTNQAYRTMTPGWFNSRACVFYITGKGILGLQDIDYLWGIRPVINLRADVKLSGDGTQNNPYTVS